MRRSVIGWRIGVVSSCLLVLGLVLMGQQAGQAETATLSPQVAAVVPAQGKLHITVDLSHLGLKQLPAKLPVELLDPRGKSLAKGEATGQKDRPAHFTLELSTPKLAADKLKLVCRVNGQVYSVPVGKVLLAKTHETTLAASQEFFAGSTTAIRCAVHGVRSMTFVSKASRCMSTRGRPAKIDARIVHCTIALTIEPD